MSMIELIIDPSPQGSDEWKQVRCGKVTASRFKDVMTKGRGVTADNYRNELYAEHFTGIPKYEINAKALKWGNYHEPAGRTAYSFHRNLPVVKTGFVMRKDIPGVGTSVDGLVGDDGVMEIKCPYDFATHAMNLRFKKLDKRYVWQVQGHLWITGRKWCDFVSFDPRYKDVAKQLSIITVERDDEMIEELEYQVLEFRAKLDHEIERDTEKTDGDDE